MPKLKDIVETVKILTGVGKLKKPADWPANPFEEQLKHLGGFKDSFLATATGRESKALTAWMNMKIVNARDQRILQYLRSKGVLI
jgi:hypothetical protein